MTSLELGSSDVRIMLWHMCQYGLAAILEDAGVQNVRTSWSPSMRPRARIEADVGSESLLAEAVIAHAAERTAAPSWVNQDVTLDGTPRGLMSPRIKELKDPAVRTDVQHRRHLVLDELTDARKLLDLRLLSALGEPAYWSVNSQGSSLQDHGASRLEMQPRNQGSEFVRARLRKLAIAVAQRSPNQVLDGLVGRSICDESESGNPDSRTATGFASPGPTDNAVAWCGLWGISQLPIAAHINNPAATSGHLGKGETEWFYLPYWTAPRRPAWTRSLLAAHQLGVAASRGLPQRWRAADSEVLAANAWLATRGVTGIVRFPIERFGSASAPERRAMLGTPLRLGDGGPDGRPRAT